MKKFFNLLIYAILFFSLFSCATTKSGKKQNLNFEPVNLPEINMASVSRISGELDPRTVSFVYTPKSNVLSFFHKYLGDSIWISLKEEHRQVMIKAINQYLDEYKAGRLTQANDKKKAYFGKTPCFLEWGLFSISHNTEPDLRFEYQLIGEKKLPYFIIATATKRASDGSANSPAIRLAASPAKCQELLQRLDQTNLDTIVKELMRDFETFDLDPEFDIKANILDNTKESNEAFTVDEAEFEF